MSFEEHIIEAVKAVMPKMAKVQVVQGVDALNIAASWRLHDDPDRPNKMSRTISICVSLEAVQDFSSASGADQAAAYGRLAAFLSAKLAAFDPQHNAPKYDPPPVEQWVITSAIVLA